MGSCGLTNEQMLAALAALPDAECLRESKITDPVGSDALYCARTVVRLLAKERERNETELKRLRHALEHIATYPRLRKDELGYAGARKIAWAALQVPNASLISTNGSNF